MRRRQAMAKTVATALVVSFLAATVGVLALSVGGGDDPTEELSGDAEELLELLDKRDDATYHAKYEASAPGTQGLVVETWQSPPNVRQDSEIRSGTQVVRARVLASSEGRVRCSQLNDAGWQCRPASAAEAQDPLASFRQRLGQGTVTATDASIDGREVRCFEMATPEGTSKLCAVPTTGVPVSVEGGETELRLVTLDDAVDSELFQPPAPVIGS